MAKTAISLDQVIKMLNEQGWTSERTPVGRNEVPLKAVIIGAQLVDNRLIVSRGDGKSSDLKLRPDDVFELERDGSSYKIVIARSRLVKQQKSMADGGEVVEKLMPIDIITFLYTGDMAAIEHTRWKQASEERAAARTAFFERQLLAVGGTSIEAFLPAEQGFTIVLSGGRQLSASIAFDEHKVPYLRFEGTRNEVLNLATGLPPTP